MQDCLVGRAWVTCPYVLGPTSRKRGNSWPSGCCDGRQAGLPWRAVCVTFSGLSGESLVWSQLHGSACGLQIFCLPQSVHSDYIAFFPHHQLHIWGMDKNWFSSKILRASCGVCSCGMEQIKKNPASDIGNRPVDIVGKKRVGWIESSIEIYKPPCVKQITSEKLLYKTGSLTWCSVTIWRCGMGLKMGGRFKRRGHTYTYGWLTSMYSRKQHNIVKQLSSN